jgi:hypothetical protein
MSSQSLGKKARAALDLAQDLKLDSALSSAKKLFLEFQSPEFSVAKLAAEQIPLPLLQFFCLCSCDFYIVLLLVFLL